MTGGKLKTSSYAAVDSSGSKKSKGPKISCMSSASTADGPTLGPLQREHHKTFP
jgi:hypothetical protein